MALSDKPIFTGAVPHEEVTRWISATGLGVATFIKEKKRKIGFSPQKIYEYMSFATSKFGIYRTKQRSNLSRTREPKTN